MDFQRNAICPFHAVHEFRDCKRLCRWQKGIDQGGQQKISRMKGYDFCHVPQECQNIVCLFFRVFHIVLSSNFRSLSVILPIVKL